MVVKETSSGSGRLLFGALVIIIGVFISTTGIGALLGVPMVFFGFAIAFPKFTAAAVILGILAFFWVLTQF